ncbi:MAG TPA: hypothetical protein PLN69_00845, partial [bacterium]|nr:hypothetical protein [bacterium]
MIVLGASIIFAGPNTVVQIDRTKFDNRVCSAGGALVPASKYDMANCVLFNTDSNDSMKSGDEIAVRGASNGIYILDWTPLTITCAYTTACTNTFSPVYTSNPALPNTEYVAVLRRSGSEYISATFTFEDVPPTIDSSGVTDDQQWINTARSYNVSFSDGTGYLDEAYHCAYSSGSCDIYGWTRIFDSGNGTTNNYHDYTSSWTISWDSLPEGKSYIRAKAVDALGNLYEADVFEVWKDTIAPDATITDNPDPSYTNNSVVTINWTGGENTTNKSGLKGFYIDVSEDNGGWSTIETLTTNYTTTHTGTDGHSYNYRVMGEDNIGNQSEWSAQAVSIMVDLTAPTHSLDPLPVSGYHNIASLGGEGNTAVDISINCSDPVPGGGVVSSGVYKIYLDYWDETVDGTWKDTPVAVDCSGSTTYEFSAIQGHKYHFRAYAEDNAGNTDSYDAAAPDTPIVLVDSLPPQNSYVEPLAPFGGAATVTVTWTGGDDQGSGDSPVTGSGRDCYDVQVRKMTPTSSSWELWQDCTTATTGQFNTDAPPAGIDSGGGTYQFRSRARDLAGNFEDYPNEWPDDSSYDTSIIVDTTPPVFSNVYDGTGADIEFTGLPRGELSANWHAEDTDTGVDTLDYYEYCIGTGTGEATKNDILDWQNIGTAETMTETGLTLIHNTVYYITIRACNDAGLCAEQASNGVKYDTQYPTVNMSEPNAPYVGDTTFQVAWSGEDGTGESGLNDYTVEVRDGTGGAWVPLPNMSETTEVSMQFTSGVNGHTYFFRVRARDNVGNESENPTTPDYHVSTTVDTSTLSAPSGISDGSETEDDSDYSSNTTEFSGHWSPVNGAVSYSYAIGSSALGTDIVDWTEAAGISFTETGLSLVNGTKYYLSVKAKNFAGEFSTNVGTSDGITIDTDVPSCAVTALDPYQSMASFAVQWSGDDGAGSGVEPNAGFDVQYKIGATGIWTDWLTSTNKTAENFGGADGEKYYFQCRVRDRAGNESTYIDGDGDTSTTVDTSVLVPPDTINDSSGADITYSADTTSIAANWSAVDGAASYDVCFGTGEVPDNCDLMAWTDVGAATTYQLTGQSFTAGDTYFAMVRSKNLSGTPGASSYSDGFTVDDQPPGTPVFTGAPASPPDISNNDSQIDRSWTAVEGVSYIYEYKYGIGTQPDGSDVAEWISNSINTSVSYSTSMNDNVIYYISVKAISGAGVESAVATSYGTLIDVTSPTCQVNVLAEYQGTVGFDVSWQGGDSGSGLNGLYDIQVKDGNTGEWTNWLTMMPVTSSTYTGENGHTYYFQCRSQDNAGNWTEYADGDGDTSTTLDTIEAVAPSVNDGVSDDIDFTVSEDTLSANWNVLDGAAAYLYAVGVESDASDLNDIDYTETTETNVEITGLTLTQGETYYISVRGRNLAGVRGEIGTSDGILVDRTAPSAPVVIVPDTTTSSRDYLNTTSWNSTDGETEIIEYMVAVGTDTSNETGMTDIRTWYSVGTQNEDVIVSGLSLEHGQTYYISVKAKNQSELWSDPGSSDGITVDTTLLPGPDNLIDGTDQDLEFTASTTELSATWSAVGDASSYDYAIGTTQGGADVLGWTNTTGVTVTESGLSLTQGASYYFAVKARNSADIAGVMSVSDGVVVDAEPPSVPVVADEGTYTTDNSKLNISWSSTAGLSGIDEYQYAVGTTQGGSDVLGWTSASTNLSDEISVSLPDGGPYYASVKAKSGTGVWSDSGSSDGIRVDTEAPACSVDAIAEYQSTNSFSVEWQASDSLSGISGYYYVQVKTNDGLWGDWKLNSQLTGDTFTGSNGNTYYFRCRAKDIAGNWGEYQTEEGDASTIVDSEPPATPVVRDGAAGDEMYTTSASSLSGNWDEITAATEYEYTIGSSQGESDILGMWVATNDVSFSRSGLTLLNNNTYYVTVRAYNHSGLFSEGYSNGILVDNEPPVEPVVTQPEGYTNITSYLESEWTSSDAESGISEYKVSIGTAAGLSDVKDWYSVGTDESAVISGLSLQNGQTYYVNVRAYDNAGLESDTGTSPAVIVDSSLLAAPETINDGVAADESFTDSNDQLSGNWTEVSGAAKYEYAVGSSPGAQNVVAWTDNALATSFSETGLSLSDGVRYYVAVRATNNSGVVGVTGISNGILVDTLAPAVPVVTDQGEYTTDDGSIIVEWSATAGYSGIVEYQYAVGSTSGSDDVVSWTSSGTDTDADITVSLSDGSTYYVLVKALSGAGVWSDAGSSDGITVDTTAPVCTVSALSEYQSVEDFSVAWTASDGGSGLAALYSVQVKNGATGAWTNWKSNTTQTDYIYDRGRNGNTYYFQCKAKDVAGNWSEYPGGDGDAYTTIDAIAPAAPVVLDGTGADEDYSSSGDTLSANWAVPQYAVEYSYAIGSETQGTDILDWTVTTDHSFTRTGLDLSQHLNYYVSVKARNNAGLESGPGTSDGILVDTTAPSTPVVNHPDAYTSSTDRLEASWTSSDEESGIVEYQVSVGSSAGATDVKGWYSAETNTSAVITGISLSDTSTYFVNVKSKNQVGLWSEAGSSSGVTVDSSLLPAPASVKDGTGSDEDYSSDATQLSANWTAISGAVKYEYAIGTTPGIRDVVDWTDVGTNTGVTKTGLSLSSGTTYYFSVRGRNQVDVPGVSGTSDGIVIDTAAPGVPVVTDEGSYTSDNSRLYASWTAVPGISGISEYQYAVGTTAGGTEVAGWASNGTGTSKTLNIVLDNAVTYYVSVRASSVAGVWSEAGVSDGITVDTVSPTCAVQPLAGYQSSSTFEVSWTGSDDGSGMAGLYDIQVRDGAGGDWSLWLSSETGTSDSYIGQNDHTYYFKCRAKDNAGNWSEYPAEPDTQTTLSTVVPQQLTVRDGVSGDIEYSTSADSFSANWSTDSNAADYAYAVGTTEGGTDVVDWTVTTSTSFALDGLNLANNTIYYTAVKARNNFGTYGETGVSDGVLIDTQAPSKPAVETYDQYTSSKTQLNVQWSSSDAESGLSSYMVSVGTAAGQDDVRTWYDEGLNTQGPITGLSLDDGTTYYINVKAGDNAGLWSEIGTSNGITVDSNLLPAPSHVYDGLTSTDRSYTTSQTTLSANWSSVSGASGYEYAMGTAPAGTDVVDWTDAATALTIAKNDLSLVNGDTYYVSVRGINNAGVKGEIGSSNGIMVETTPPSAPEVTDGGDQINFDQSLQASWTSSDAESGIAQYEYAVGTSKEEQNVLGWTSAGLKTSITIDKVSLVAGNTYYVFARATNAAGLVGEAGVTDGIDAITSANVTITKIDNEPSANYFNRSNPGIVTVLPDDEDLSITKEVTFYESNG